MRPTFTVTVPATSRLLLTLAEMRIATGATLPDTPDAVLDILNATISADIAAACNVRADGVHQPTLMLETVTDVYRPDRAMTSRSRAQIILSRRPVSNLAIVENDITLVNGTDFILDPVTGIASRVHDLILTDWFFWAFDLSTAAITATYDGGLTEVPDDLRGAAMELARIRWFQSLRDPSARQEVVDGVGSVTYWVGNPSDVYGDIPQSILGRLARFTNQLVA